MSFVVVAPALELIGQKLCFFANDSSRPIEALNTKNVASSLIATEGDIETTTHTHAPMSI